jgi:hypothetical protein
MRLLAIIVALGACQSNLDATREVAALDRPYFDCKVQPVLTKYCGQLACHGDAGRFFRVYARNRFRDGGDEMQREIALRTSERDHNYAAASAFVDLAHPAESLLVQKPLDQSAGGRFHVGETLFARGNVFATRDDPDYQILEQWIAGATEDPTCMEPGSNL